MNNISTPDCSSGCESGWTTYFYELSNSNNPNNSRQVSNVNDDAEDEDPSMVSDASSGPQKVHEDYGVEPRSFGYSSASLEQVKKKSKLKTKTKEARIMMKMNYSLCLEDTASSPFLHFSQEEQQHMPENSLGTCKSSTREKSGSLKGRKRQ